MHVTAAPSFSEDATSSMPKFEILKPFESMRTAYQLLLVV